MQRILILQVQYNHHHTTMHQALVQLTYPSQQSCEVGAIIISSSKDEEAEAERE